MAPTLKPQKRSLTVYLAGAPFNLRDLIGNAYLAEAIYEKSHGRYLCQLPQDFALRGRGAQAIRDRLIRALFSADCALFIFDGAEIDSGTIVELMLAKFADIPAVVVRTDLRGGGDQPVGGRRDPWNLLASFYPRTFVLRSESLHEYRKQRQTAATKPRDEVIHLAGQHASATASLICDRLAAQVVRALDRVRQIPPQMPKYLREEVYQWLALMPGLRGKAKGLRKELETALERKVKKDLL